MICPNLSLYPFKMIAAVHGREAAYYVHTLFEDSNFKEWKGDDRLPEVDENFIVRSNTGAEWNLNTTLREFRNRKGLERFTKYIPGERAGSDAHIVLSILANSASDSNIRELSSKLLERDDLIKHIRVRVVDDIRGGAIGQFQLHSDTILIAANGLKTVEEIETTIFHELLHAFTSVAINQPDTAAAKDFKDRISQLYKFASIASREKSTREWYGLISESEFISELFANQEFRDHVKSLREGNIWTRFLDVIKRLLGVETNIANETIETTIEYITNATYIHWRGENITFQREASTKREKGIINEKLEIIRNIQRSLRNRINDFREQANSPTAKENIAKLKQEALEIEKLLENNLHDEILLESVSRAEKHTNQVLDRLNLAITHKALTLPMLNDAMRYIGAFKYLEDFRLLMASDPELRSKHPEIDSAINRIEGTIKLIGDYNRNYAPGLLVDKIAFDDSRTENKYIKKYEKEFGARDKAKYPTQQEFLDARRRYVDQQFNTHKNEIESEKRRRLTAELRQGEKDIGRLSSFLRGFQDLGDDILALAKKAFDRAMDRVRHRYVPFEKDLTDKWEALKNFKGSVRDPQKLYEEILEKDSNGNLTGYYVSYYRQGEFAALKNTLTEKMQDITDEVDKHLMWRQFREENYEREYTDEFYEAFNKIVPNKNREYLKLNIEINNILNLYRKVNGTIDYSSMSTDVTEQVRSLSQRREAVRDKLTKKQYAQLQELVEFKELPEFQQEKDRRKSILSNEEYQRWETAQYVVINGKRVPLTIWTKMVPKDQKYINRDYIAAGQLKSKWINSQHTILEKAHPAVKDFYDFVIARQQEFDKNRPEHKRLGYRMPASRKTITEKVSSGDMSLAAVRESWKEATQRQEDDTEYGETTVYEDAEGNIRRTVPIFYTSVVPLAEMSFDVATLTAKNAYTTMTYEERVKLVPQMEALRRTIATRRVLERDKMGRAVLDSSGRQRTIEGTQTVVFEALENMLSKELYNIKKHPEKVAEVVDRIVAFNSNLLLGGNIRAAVANLTVGQVTANIHFLAGGEISRKSWSKAYHHTMGNAASSMADIGSFYPTSRTNTLLRHFDGLNNFGEALGDYVKKGAIVNFATSGGLFHGLTSAVENFTQSLTMYGVLEDIQVLGIEETPVLNEAGEPMTLADAYQTENGEVKLDPRVKKMVFNGRTIDASPENFFLITQKIRGLNKRLHGAYSNQNRGEIYRHWWGRLIMQMRGWLVPQWDKRWRGAGSIVDVAKGRDLRDMEYEWEIGINYEGHYATFGKWAINWMNALRGMHIEALRYEQMSEEERQNFRRAILEIGTAIGAMIMVSALLSAAESGDEEEEDKYIYFAAYEMVRLQTELMFFYNPSDMLKIVSDPAAALTTLNAFIALMIQLVPPNTFEVYEKGRRKGQLKLRKKIEDFIPLWRFREPLVGAKDALSYYNWGN